MVENGVQFAGIVGENRKKKQLDNALFLGVAEKSCAYVHFFLDYAHMDIYFYFHGAMEPKKNKGKHYA